MSIYGHRRRSNERFLRILWTARYLKAEQIFFRVIRRLRRSRPILLPAPPLRRQRGRFIASPTHHGRLVGERAFRFLNIVADLSESDGWNSRSQSRLWLYNLHYFDWILPPLSGGVAERWLARWIRENPPGHGVGWEPYPTSLRIVNWIKWALLGRELAGAVLESLAAQLGWLRSNLERYLLGNHLFANAKALIFGGLFFTGSEAARWLESGTRILRRELVEQILADGGHFERSPMYHEQVLCDILDIINLQSCYGLPAEGTLEEAAAKMAQWLDGMTHPDGEISFFNDAVTGIEPSPVEIRSYASRLGISAPTRRRKGLRVLAESGFARFESQQYVCIVDLGRLGPDYLCGHAHADSFTFELSIGGKRVFVNSGISTYEKGETRQRERGTSAHNTLVIDGFDSSEVWGGFRMGRRARARDLHIDEATDAASMAAVHDGYRSLPGSPMHGRRWTFQERSVRVVDTVSGGGRHKVAVYLHVHPDFTARKVDRSDAVHVEDQKGAAVATVTVRGANSISLRSYSYHASFGMDQEGAEIAAFVEGLLPLELSTVVNVL